MVERPVSAVFDLCDAAILSADLGAALGGDTARLAPRPLTRPPPR